MGLMLARLLVLAGREVTVADPHPERREQARSLGASAAERLDGVPLVFEAVGRPDGWRAALEAVAPGGVVVLVGGCPGGSRVELPADALHYDELDVRGAFHHSPAEVDRALGLLAGRDVPWEAFAGEPLALDGLGAALEQAARGGGRARKLLVDPRLPPA